VVGKTAIIDCVDPANGGKIPNASVVSEAKLLQHPNVAGLLQGLHADDVVETHFKQFKFKRVVLLGDPDIDGLHAVLLLVLLLTRYLPELIAQHHLYMLRAPGFGFYRNGDCVAHAYNKEQMEQVKVRFGAAPIDIRRFKGIGSMESQLLSRLLATNSGFRQLLSLPECEKMCALVLNK